MYAIINNGLVTNTIKADAAFADLIRADHDAVVEITGITPQPGIGWLYDGEVFTDPNATPDPAPVPE